MPLTFYQIKTLPLLTPSVFVNQFSNISYGIYLFFNILRWQAAK